MSLLAFVIGIFELLAILVAIGLVIAVVLGVRLLK